MESVFPKCSQCGEGYLLPLSDGTMGNSPASVPFKAWVCSNPQCHYNLSLKKGEIIENSRIVNDSDK